MNRKTGIVITVLSIILCACPGLCLIGFGAIALLSTQSPEVMAEASGTMQDIVVGSFAFICPGFIMLLVPVVLGTIMALVTRNDQPAPLPVYKQASYEKPAEKPVELPGLPPDEPLPPPS
jgi:hypothetical protein